MPSPHEYKHIAAWGKLLGSKQYYINAEQRAAAEQNAPLTAIYKHNGRWITIDDCVVTTQREVNAYVERMK